ncbi:type III pantothenate kinase [Stratiformator vulcanicus]|uniref:Type III pantothenate kinase n=1 Tax=Stratiformator vulcanicus TaxID=2527980 RepID=A0A517R6W7_9PLAN|nr:type III pantothenate kinase [Stratiformator vulcanicus]QDT39634.1 Type III pantothenate kinase [Stratiformator vulcanicus]
MAAASSALIAADVGNTRVKLGYFDGTLDASGLPVCGSRFAISVNACADLGPVKRWLDETGAGSEPRVVVSDVNPAVTRDLTRAWKEQLGTKPEQIRRPDPQILENRTDHPARTGPDRLFNAVAANVLRPKAKPAIIIDAGTATTIDLVAADGAFEGGAILPGFALSAQALQSYTALLPLVASDDVTDSRPNPLGRNTRDAIRSGLYWGGVGAVIELVRRISIELDDQPAIYLTGGAAPRLVPYVAQARHLPTFALQGMVLTSRRSAGTREESNCGD